jgi:hypothetical protein
MFNPVLFSCFSIISLNQYGFLKLMDNLKTNAEERKRVKRNGKLKNAIDRLEKVGLELQDRINGNQTMADIPAMRLLDIAECKKIVTAECENKDDKLNIVVGKLTKLINECEECSKCRTVQVETCKMMLSEIEECKNIIESEMKQVNLKFICC